MFELSGSRWMPANKSTDMLRFFTSTIGAAALFLASSLWPLSSQGSSPADVETFKSTGSCPGCDLSGAFLDAVDAQGGDMWNANLSNASLYRALLGQADLSGADLSGANLTRASLDGADLSSTSLLSADLTDATFSLAITAGVLTDASTTCPDGSVGPCDLQGNN